jgi:hypothetical protein
MPWLVSKTALFDESIDDDGQLVEPFCDSIQYFCLSSVLAEESDGAMFRLKGPWWKPSVVSMSIFIRLGR